MPLYADYFVTKNTIGLLGNKTTGQLLNRQRVWTANQKQQKIANFYFEKQKKTLRSKESPRLNPIKQWGKFY